MQKILCKKCNNLKHIFCAIRLKNRMLADVYIPRVSNDMKIAVPKKSFKNQLLCIEIWTFLKNGVFEFDYEKLQKNGKT